MNDLWGYLGITPLGALAVVIAATTLYFLFSAIHVIWWRHFKTTNNAFAFTLTVLLGAITARATLGNTPTLVGGIISVSTLIALEIITDKIRRHPSFERRGTRSQADVVMVGQEMDHEVLRKHGITTDEVWVALRRAGIRTPDRVGAAILESDGAVTVIRKDQPIDPQLLVSVRGAEKLAALQN